MNLILKPSSEIPEEFIKWMIPKIKLEILHAINMDKVKLFNKEINELDIIEKRDKDKEDLFYIQYAIKIALNNIKYHKIKDAYIIDMKCNKIYPNYYISVDDAIKLFTYGNMQIKGYPIIPKVLNNISKNIKKYYKEYLIEWGII